MSHAEILIKHAVVAAGEGNVCVAFVQGAELASLVVVVERVQLHFWQVHADEHIVAGSVVLALLGVIEQFVEDAAQGIDFVDGVFLGDLFVLLELAHILGLAF